MVFLRASIGADPHPVVRGRDVWLRPPQMSDYPAWAELRARSRSHLERWEPSWSGDELSRAAWKRRVRHWAREAREDLGYAFLIFDEGEETLVGGLSLGNVRRGVTQSAALGYWLGRPYTGQGRMTDAVAAIAAYALGPLGLHRLEAASMPENTASIAVLQRTGFEREGYARRYLLIDGAWRDHVLYARTAPDRGTTGEHAA